jgi:two-component system NtrC family sensor kinase
VTALIDLVVRSEDLLLEKVLAEAEEEGYFRFAARDPEAWRPSVRGLSGSLVQACRRGAEPPLLTAEDVGRDDSLAAFSVAEARKRRLGGMPLGIFLGLLKVFRNAYAHVVRSAGLPPGEEARCLQYVAGFFDRNEVACAVSWTMESSFERVEELVRRHDELSRLYGQVERAKKEWEGTIDCVDDMLLLADAHRRIRRCNRAFRRFLGRPYAEILGKPFEQALAEAGVAADLSPGKETECFHERSGRWLVIKRYPFAGAPGIDISGTIVTIHDATQLKKASEDIAGKNARLKEAFSELRQAQAQVLQQERTAALGQLAAGVAREINSPMRFIGSNLATLGKYLSRMTEFVLAQSECIAAGAPPAMAEALRKRRAQLGLDYILDDLEELVRESVDGAEQVRSIVADLKGFSPGDEADVRRVDVNECIRSAANIVWNEIKHKAKLRRELSELPLTRGNPRQLSRVFTDLLAHAAQAIEQQGTITVRSWAKDGYVCASVADTGQGTPPEELERILDPFRAAAEEGKGTGLGLSVARDIVRKHNGEMAARSEEGKGTTFTVRIPIVAET